MDYKYCIFLFTPSYLYYCIYKSNFVVYPFIFVPHLQPVFPPDSIYSPKAVLVDASIVVSSTELKALFFIQAFSPVSQAQTLLLLNYIISLPYLLPLHLLIKESIFNTTLSREHPSLSPAGPSH